jgi:hypothetical protein
MQFLGNSASHRARCQATWLGVANHLDEAASELKADFGKLGRFAGSGFTTDDHDLMRGDRSGDLLATPTNWQILGIGDRRGKSWGNDNAFWP